MSRKSCQPRSAHEFDPSKVSDVRLRFFAKKDLYENLITELRKGGNLESAEVVVTLRNAQSGRRSIIRRDDVLSLYIDYEDGFSKINRMTIRGASIKKLPLPRKTRTVG